METLETVFLSRLQHYLYCPRQFGLIELEDVWVENRFTAEGQVLHERVNQQEQEQRGNIRTVRALPLCHATLGIEGIADVVELHRTADGNEQPYPIEYKRGKPKTHRADEVQLCAQALCLEDMYQCTIDEGALFYGETRRRQKVLFDASLRELTFTTIAACRDIVATKTTPTAVYELKKCRGCSLIEQCHPKQFMRSGRHWLNKQLNEPTNSNTH